ncbi:MAG: ferrochelatase [Asticcacaulis sp.]
MKKVAVVLFNLGGPLTQADVRPFLYNLFSDRFIINLPWPFRQMVAALISSRREVSAQANYQLMGGGSPIVKETEAQADALAAHLKTSVKDIEFKVFTGMRYWHPFTEETVKAVEAWEPDQVIALPLYPQFSTTTTLSSFVTFKKQYKGSAPVKYLCDYPQNPAFAEAYAGLIRQKLSGLSNLKDYRLLFSAHGLPEKVIRDGDPYQAQVEASVAAIMAQVGEGIDHVICYQSRVGPLKWIGPSTDETIIETVKAGKSPVIVPVAFVSEHIETLVELDIEYRHLADENGAKDYVRVPVVGVEPLFIQGLSDEVLRAMASETSVIGDPAFSKAVHTCLNREGVR